jgi:hypothetical protein
MLRWARARGRRSRWPLRCITAPLGWRSRCSRAWCSRCPLRCRTANRCRRRRPLRGTRRSYGTRGCGWCALGICTRLLRIRCTPCYWGFCLSRCGTWTRRFPRSRRARWQETAFSPTGPRQRRGARSGRPLRCGRRRRSMQTHRIRRRCLGRSGGLVGRWRIRRLGSPIRI